MSGTGGVRVDRLAELRWTETNLVVNGKAWDGCCHSVATTITGWSGRSETR
jgi:hypothetical protein